MLVQFTFKRKRSNKKKTKLPYHLIKQMSKQPGLKMDMDKKRDKMAVLNGQNGVFWSHVIDRLGKIQDFTERGEIRTTEWGPVWVGSKVSLTGKGFSKNKVLVNGISGILRPSKRY